MNYFNQTQLVENTNEDKQAVIGMYFVHLLNFVV